RDGGGHLLRPEMKREASLGAHEDMHDRPVQRRPVGVDVGECFEAPPRSGHLAALAISVPLDLDDLARLGAKAWPAHQFGSLWRSSTESGPEANRIVSGSAASEGACLHRMSAHSRACRTSIILRLALASSPVASVGILDGNVRRSRPTPTSPRAVDPSGL